MEEKERARQHVIAHDGHRPLALDAALAPHRQLHPIRSIGTDASG